MHSRPHQACRDVLKAQLAIETKRAEDAERAREGAFTNLRNMSDALGAAEAKLAMVVERGNRLAVVVRAYFDEHSAVGGVELLAAIDEYTPVDDNGARKS